MEDHSRPAPTPDEPAPVRRIEEAREKKTPAYEVTGARTTNEFLDAVRERYGLLSDYRLAQFLKLGQTTISSYRTERSRLHDTVCVDVARALNIDPRYVLATIAAERSPVPEIAGYWRSVARVIKSGAPLLLLVAVQFAIGFNDDGIASAAPLQAIHYTHWLALVACFALGYARVRCASRSMNGSPSATGFPKPRSYACLAFIGRLYGDGEPGHPVFPRPRAL